MLSKSLRESDANAIAHFVNACEDGRAFYAHAAQETTLGDLRSLFDHQVMLRSNAEKVLDAEYSKRTDKALKHHLTFGGRLEEWYADARLALHDESQSNYILISELEKCEDRTLIAMQRAINEALDPSLKNLMNDLLTPFIKSHQQMLKYKHAMEDSLPPAFAS